MKGDVLKPLRIKRILIRRNKILELRRLVVKDKRYQAVCGMPAIRSAFVAENGYFTHQAPEKRIAGGLPPAFR